MDDPQTIQPEPFYLIEALAWGDRESWAEALHRINTPYEPPPPPAWVNRRVCRQRPRLPRLKRKERLNWHQWFSDWYSALYKLGYRCRNKGISPNRKSITAKDVKQITILYMQKGDQAVYLYSSVKALPPRGACIGWLEDGAHIKTITRIVQGRRRDPSRGVTRLAGTTATGIIPKFDMQDRAEFYVDFDGALFDRSPDGVWQETKNCSAGGLYSEYLKTSNHYKSIRPYYKAAKFDCPTEEPTDDKNQILGSDLPASFQKITKLL